MPGGEIGVKKSSPERVQPQSFQKHRRAGASPQEAEKKEEFLRMETSIDCAILQLCSCAPVRVACDNPPPHSPKASEQHLALSLYMCLPNPDVSDF